MGALLYAQQPPAPAAGGGAQDHVAALKQSLQQGAARFPKAKRLLVAHEHATRKPPAGIQVMDAWRSLLDAPLKA
jgi:hypothetical protein